MTIIKGTDYNKNLVYPKKTQKTLDESLNQGVITLKNMVSELPFEPLDEVVLNGNQWLVGSDNVVQKVFGNKKRYQNDITLLERVKILEKDFVDSCTFRNPLIKLYLNNPIKAPYRKLNKDEIYNLLVNVFQENVSYNLLQDKEIFTPNINLYTPQQNGVDFTTDNYTDLLTFNKGTSVNDCWNGYVIKDAYDTVIYSNLSKYSTSATIPVIENPIKNNYYLYLFASTPVGVVNWGVDGICITITFMNDLDELSDYTITDVVNRLLAITETQRYGDSPRFTFNSEQATKYASVLAPEFTFTKMNLFEALKQVGSYIHAKPELHDNEISFKELGQREYAILPKNYVGYSASQSVEQFCSEIDTNVDNLVNTDASNSGSIVEPFETGLKTMRAETGIATLTENSCLFETTLPIETVDYFEIGYLSDGVKVGDVTKYIYLKDEYDNLSSYSAEYPWSKAYALYFKEGQKNIYGANFEEEDAKSQIFKHPAIINIINAVTGGNYDTLFSTEPMIKLQYKIRYKPLISSRLKQRKTNLNETSKKAVLAYNQSASKIDTDFYGENLKGVVERLGNIEKVYTYICKKTDVVPEVGQLFDDEYYISVVKEEEFYDYKKYSLGLSKNWNRWNEYVGINNDIRFWEVAKKYLERFVIYEDYLVISNDFDIETDAYDKSIIQSPMLNVLKQNFTPPESELNWYPFTNISCIQAETFDKNMNTIAKVVLPAISSYLGNSAFYQLQFNNNFGAGSYIEYFITGSKGAQAEAEYGDDYGRAEYIGIKGLYQPKLIPPTNYSSAVELGRKIPLIDIDSEIPKLFDTESNPIILKKDGGEQIILPYQVHCVTNKNSLIIGSGLPKKMGVKNISFADREYVDIYVMNREIGKFEKEITDLPSSDKRITYTLTVDGANKQLNFGEITLNARGKSIVLVDRASKELIFAINEEVTNGQSYQLPSLCFRHKI
jgi:hypothetical protein